MDVPRQMCDAISLSTSYECFKIKKYNFSVLFYLIQEEELFSPYTHGPKTD